VLFYVSLEAAGNKAAGRIALLAEDSWRMPLKSPGMQQSFIPSKTGQRLSSQLVFIFLINMIGANI
jgi:hypothetical protein